jgi:hypothetical protein
VEGGSQCGVSKGYAGPGAMAHPILLLDRAMFPTVSSVLGQHHDGFPIAIFHRCTG